MSFYQGKIAKIAPGKNARHIEAWLRCEYGTLDALSAPAFERAVNIAVVLAEDVELSERLAGTQGL